MTKSELNARFAALLESEDISSVKEEIKSIKEEFNQAIEEVVAPEIPSFAADADHAPESAETASEPSEPDAVVSEEAPAEATDESEASETAQTEPATPAPKVKTQDDIFNDLCKLFNKRMAEHRAMIERQREQSLKVKEQLVKEMIALVDGDEQNFKALFEEFNRINDAWKTAGPVPMEAARDLNERFYHAKNNFFYKFRIQQELRELDLKKNRVAREVIITRAAGLENIENIKEMEEYIDLLKHDWNEAGVVSQEDFKELADKFYGILRQYDERITAHYVGLRHEQENNIGLKKDIIARAKALAESSEGEGETWKAKADKMLALQEEWKGVGFIKREKNEELWKEFREVCDAFFAKRNEFFKEADAAAEANKAAKQQLIEKAVALKDSTDWGKATKELKELQDAWKNTGRLRHKEEEKLWNSFRKACNHFFDRKKVHFGDIKGEQENNLFLKNNLIEEVENFVFSGERHTDLAKLKEFNERWSAIGFVPRNDIDATIKRFRAAMDKHFKKLDAETDERQLNRFKEKMQSSGTGKDDYQIKKEQQFLRDKIETLKHEILQYKSNIMIFTGAGAANLHKEIEKKIANAEKEIEQNKKKLEVLKNLKPVE